MDIKRIAIFFEDSRLWLGASGRWRAEKGCLDGNKERFVQIESVWFVKTFGV